MHATATADPMKMTHAQQHAIFSKYSWTTDGRIRVQCTHRTEALLKLAGINHPKPLEYYPLPAKRDLKGFLILDSEITTQRPPVSESDDSLFETGGIFSDADRPPVNVVSIQHAVAARKNSQRCEISAELAALSEIPATRTFEILVDSHAKLRVQVIAFDDTSLPSPSEVENWKPVKPTNAQVHAAIAALHLAIDLKHFEQL